MLFAVWTSGGVEFIVPVLGAKPPFNTPSKQQEVRTTFNARTVLNLPEDSFTTFPGIGLVDLQQLRDLQQLLAAFDGWWRRSERRN